MSEEVTLYKFSKRLNSTKLAGVGHQCTGNFRGPVDIMTPVIDIEMANGMFDYNYLTWFDSAVNMIRYYWIRHKVYFPNNIVKLQLEEDVLPTFKTDINAKEFFIERSSSIGNELGTDIMPVSINGIETSVSVANPFEHFDDGWYVVGVAGADNNLVKFAEISGICYFICDKTTVKSLSDWLNNQGSSGEWADYNPISRVISIRYFPIDFTAHSVSEYVQLFEHTYTDSDGNTQHASFIWTGTFGVGSWYPEITNDVIYTKNFTMTMSDHSQYSANQRYLNYPPYREVTLFAGAFGKIDIPIDLLKETDSRTSLDIDVVFDLISGLSRIDLYFIQSDNTRRLIYSNEDYSMTVNCAITSQEYNKYSDIMSRDLRKSQNFGEMVAKGGAAAASMAVGALTSNPLLLGSGIALAANTATTQIAGMKQYALDSYMLSIPDQHTKGTTGSFSMLERPWVLFTISHKILPLAADLIGYSCNQKARISDSSGYTKCIGASFESNKATLDEILAINDFLNNGFYNE